MTEDKLKAELLEALVPFYGLPITEETKAWMVKEIEAVLDRRRRRQLDGTG